MITVPITHFKTSDFLRDFLQGASPARSMFNNNVVTAELCKKRAQHGASKSRLKTLFENGLRGTTISEAQQNSLISITQPNAVVVCGGQQIGMFGGPLYTLLKMRSIVVEANSISAEFGVPVVPVFWLEDVDHDAAEASEVWLTSADGSAECKSVWDGTKDKLPSFKRHFSESEIDAIRDLGKGLIGQYGEQVQQLVSGTYLVGRTWTEAFLDILEPFMQAWGVVVVRASDVVLYGMHAPICIRDCEQTDELAKQIEKSSQLLESNGYHRQATVQPFQFLVETPNGRNRIEPHHNPLSNDSSVSINGVPYTIQQLVELARFHPEQFSPGVLARPLVQDAILPTVATILGGAEIAYHAQLFHAYQWFGIEQPVPMLRHSACIIDTKTARQLEKSGKAAEWFFRSWEQIEASATDDISKNAVPSAETGAPLINELLSPFQKSAENIDSTLVRNIHAANVAMQQQLSAIEAKLKSALKKQNSVLMDRLRAVWWAVYPNSTLQERVYPLLWFVAKHGNDEVRIIVEEACGVPRGNVAIVDLTHTLTTGIK
ncbi:MAG: bacillithiol biosynthesis cysteine-adding enzyme BshC [Ignavibacteria bacterium]|nr:bacillithiol biosynthesis cysteine-adding enzyme BshC [Ignavibacteria bacterium]